MSKESSEIPFAESLVEVTRGSITESRHRGHIAVVDGFGQVVASLGSPETVSYLRSSSKPQQALPLVLTGAADHFGFTEREVAIACGSHNGEPQHVETVRSMLSKLGLDESALKCGAHEPYCPETARQMRERGERPTPLHNNCSGKHAGMLAVALQIGADIATYYEPQNPVQLLIGRAIAEFSGIPIEDIAVGTDGCGVPTFGVTVRAMALMYARLIAPLAEWEKEKREACSRLVAAITNNPEMIGGRLESLDTALMKAAPGRLIAKAGAEGVFTGAIFPREKWPQGLGVALKIEDGDRGKRARRPATIELLRQLGALDDGIYDAVAAYAHEVIKNHRGDQVGEVRAAFELEWAAK